MIDTEIDRLFCAFAYACGAFASGGGTIGAVNAAQDAIIEHFTRPLGDDRARLEAEHCADRRAMLRTISLAERRAEIAEATRDAAQAEATRQTLASRAAAAHAQSVVNAVLDAYGACRGGSAPPAWLTALVIKLDDLARAEVTA